MPLGQAVNEGGGAQCLDDETLALLLEGSLDVDEDASVRAHLDTCVACRRLFADAARSDAPPAPLVGAPLMQSRIIAYDQLIAGDVVAGKYRLERLLGSGGMGNVVAARHVELDQLVALKVIRPEMMHDADAVKRFAREAKSAAALKSEHAVRIFDVGRLDSGMPYMVMEYLEGHDLASPIEESGPLPVDDALAYVLQACEAVGEAHEHGIVHRDLKPHNLFLTKGRSGEPCVKVLDFGLAKALATNGMDSAMTGTNVMLGSPFFMSPEQVSSTRDVDRRTDIWSLGATLYYIIAGVPPFVAPNVHLVCQRVLSEDFPPISTRRSDVPESVEKLVRRCMNRDPNARFQSIGELESAIRRVREMIKSLDSATDVRASPKWVHENDSGDTEMMVSPPQSEAPTIETPVVRTRPLTESERGLSPMVRAAPPPPPSPPPYAQQPHSGQMFPPHGSMPGYPSAPPQRSSSLPPHAHPLMSSSTSVDIPTVVTRGALAPAQQSSRLAIFVSVLALLTIGGCAVAFQIHRMRMHPTVTTPGGEPLIDPTATAITAPTTPEATTASSAKSDDRPPRNTHIAPPAPLKPRPRSSLPSSSATDPYDHP